MSTKTCCRLSVICIATSQVVVALVACIALVAHQAEPVRARANAPELDAQLLARLVCTSFSPSGKCMRWEIQNCIWLPITINRQALSPMETR